MTVQKKPHGWALRTGEKGRPDIETLRENGRRLGKLAVERKFGFNDPEISERARLKGLETRRINAKLRKKKIMKSGT